MMISISPHSMPSILRSVKKTINPIIYLSFFISHCSFGQPHSSSSTISATLPAKIEGSQRYLFYLHGGVVTVLGNNAINQSMPEWGPYEYLNILDSLAMRGCNIVSENRREGIDDSVYVNKLARQIDTLFKAKVKPQNIL